ncbi:DUF5330 domain-containing protein [Methylopila sp. M107]|uniref:DUF5330 domain-containing protein n=1 Tax=Methylopila sp. M107 TaxID=1101190 RepID=UPI0003648B9D|nr:DUF5330 domain-containing protein [Methylopila sp. M107]
MFFLIRTAFWVSLLLLVLPFGGDGKSGGPSSKDRASIDALSAMAAAGATVSDVGGFCSRQPEACTVGGQALKIVGERAREGATALTGYFAAGAKDAPTAAIDLKTGAAAKSADKSAGQVMPASAGRQTLSPSDRKPAWRGPAT